MCLVSFEQLDVSKHAHIGKPVFFCRDPIQGPDVIRSQYRNPKNFLLDKNSLFDLLANTPEGYVIRLLNTVLCLSIPETMPG